MSGCFSSEPYYSSATDKKSRGHQSYTDLFSINRVGTKPFPKQKEIDSEFKQYLKEFLWDAKRYKRLDMMNQKSLRRFKFTKNNLLRHNKKLLAICFSQSALMVSSRTKGLLKPGNPWLEIEIDKERYKKFVRNSSRRAKFLIYHVLFHCFYKEGHLPHGYVGIMEDNFYDPGDTKYHKTDEELVRELFSNKSFDILPDTR